MCGATGNLVTFAYQIRPHAAAPPAGPLQTVLRLLEFPAGSLEPLSSRDVPLQGYGFVHDFCFTEHWAIFFQNPVDLDIVPFVAGQRCPGQCLTFRPERPTLVFLVPRRDAAAPIRTATLPACFVFHHANAYEDAATGELVIDSVHMPTLDLSTGGGDFRDADFESSPRYSLWRTRIPSPAASEASVVLQARTAELSGRVCEFPCVAPARFGRPARWAYAAVGLHPTRIQPLQGWVKFDTQSPGASTGAAANTTWAPGAGFFLGEPEFIARPGADPAAAGAAEEDGWLVGWVFDSGRDVSAFAVVDARSMAQVALLRLRHHIPYGLHGTFTPQYFGPSSE